MSIARQVTATFGTKAVSFVFSFIGSVFLTRLLGAEGKGVQGFINANVALFSMLFGFNILQTLTYFIAKDDFDKAAARGLALLINISGILLFSLIIMFLYNVESTLLSLILPKEYQSFFYIAYLLILFFNSVSTSFFHGDWQGQARFDFINIVVLLQSIAHALFFGLLWYYVKYYNIPDLSLENILTVSLVIYIILFCIKLSIYIYQSPKITFKIKYVSKPIIMYSLTGFSIGILDFTVKRIDIWFIEYYNDLKQLGFYLVAVSLVDILITLLFPATLVLSPHLTNRNTSARGIVLGRFSRITTLFMVVITVSFYFFTPFIIPFLFGNTFSESISPTKYLIIGGFLLFIRNIFGVYNIATNNLYRNLIASIFAFLATISLDFLLIPKYGILGACYASVAAYFISSLFIMISVVKELNRPLKFFLIFNKNDYQYLIKIAKKQLVKY